MSEEDCVIGSHSVSYGFYITVHVKQSDVRTRVALNLSKDAIQTIFAVPLAMGSDPHMSVYLISPEFETVHVTKCVVSSRFGSKSFENLVGKEKIPTFLSTTKFTIYNSVADYKSSRVGVG